MKPFPFLHPLTSAWPGLLAAGSLLCLLAASPAAAQQPAPLPPGSCAEGRGSIAGTLRDEAGAAVAAELLAYDENGAYLEARSDSSGRYRLERACAGAYVVLAYREASPALLGFYDPDANGEPDTVLLAQDDSQVSAIDLVLRAADSVVGPAPQPAPCVQPVGAISGRVLDEAGQGVAGAEVQVVTDSGVLALATSLQDGSYKAAGLCAGSYLAAAWDELDGQPRIGIYDRDGDQMPDEVSLAADDSQVAAIDIVLQPLEPATPLPEPKVCEQPAFDAQGRVLDPEGRAVVNALVFYFAEDGSYGEGLSDDEGRYRVDLCAGSYLAFACSQQDARGFGRNRCHQVGKYDPDGDGLPDPVLLDDAHPSATDIDIVLTFEDPPAAGNGAGSRPRGLDRLRRLAPWLLEPGGQLLRLTAPQRQPRQPITVDPVRRPLD